MEKLPKSQDKSVSNEECSTVERSRLEKLTERL